MAFDVCKRYFCFFVERDFLSNPNGRENIYFERNSVSPVMVHFLVPVALKQPSDFSNTTLHYSNVPFFKIVYSVAKPYFILQ